MPFTKNIIARFRAWQATGCYQSDARPSGETDVFYLVCKKTGKRINTEDCKDCPYKEKSDD